MVVYSNLANTFTALGDATRLQILAQLEKGPKTCSDLVSHFDLTQQAVSKHIGVLSKAGLLTQTKKGRIRLCELVPHKLEDAFKWIDSKVKKPEPSTKPIIGYGSVAIVRQGGKVLAYHAPSYQ